MMKLKLPKCKPTAKPLLAVEDAQRRCSALPGFRDRLIFRTGVQWGPRTSELFAVSVDGWKGDCFEIRNTAYKGKLRRAKMKN